MAALHELTTGKPQSAASGLQPLLALHTSTDGRIVGNDIGHNSGCCNTAPKTQGLLPLPAHLTSTDGGIVGNDIWQNSRLLRHRQETHGLLPSLALLISTDGGVCDTIPGNTAV